MRIVLSTSYIFDIRWYSQVMLVVCFFFFNDTATTRIYTYGHTLSLHDALPISAGLEDVEPAGEVHAEGGVEILLSPAAHHRGEVEHRDVVAVDERAHRRRIGDVALLQRHPCVGPGGALRGQRDVEQQQIVDRRLRTVQRRQAAALQQSLRQALADEAGSAGNDDLQDVVSLLLLSRVPVACLPPAAAILTAAPRMRNAAAAVCTCQLGGAAHVCY